jgi:hypothetical protein
MSNKFFLFLSLCICTLNGYSQMPMKDGKVVYELIDSSLTGTQQQLQAKAKIWMANVFKDSREVIQVDDKDAGEVVGKGNFSWGSLPPYTCWFTIRISSRDNKYRCQIYDMMMQGGTEGAKRSIEHWIEHPTIGTKKQLRYIDKRTLEFMDDLKAAMAKSNDNF